MHANKCEHADPPYLQILGYIATGLIWRLHLETATVPVPNTSGLLTLNCGANLKHPWHA